MKKFSLLIKFIFAAFSIFMYMGCDTRQEPKQPAACFNYIPLNGIHAGDEVTFTNCSTDAESYSWNFDDGNTSVGNSPKHVFDEPGTYTVKLIVQNNSLRDQTERTITVESNITACFTINPTTAAVGETVNFSNCSTGATTYEWDADGDGVTDYTVKDISIIYYYAGTYQVKLTVKNGTAVDEVTHDITITSNVAIDPTIYDLPITWTDYYTNEFETSGDWTEETTTEYSASIAGGVYSITNFNTTNSWFFWTTTLGMPAATQNYDYEIYYKIDFDVVTQGNGIFSSLNQTQTPFEYYFLKLTSESGINYYTYGNKNNGPWDDGFYGTVTNYSDFNKLTIRKYGNTLYYFINELYYRSVPFEGNYGEKFGFVVGANSKITTEWISINTMNLGSKKSANNEIFNSAEEKYKKTVTIRERSNQTGNQAMKIPGINPTLK